jgi:beta-lactamase regulating signal transducer with metallopeptidase domain
MIRSKPMERLFILFLENSFLMSIIILLFIFITPMLSKKYKSKTRYYAWMIITLGLIIPFRPHFHDALIIIKQFPIQSPYLNSEINSDIGINHIVNKFENITVQQDHTTSMLSSNLTFIEIAVFIWILGIFLFLVYNLINHINFVKLSKRWSIDIVDANIIEMLTIVCRKLNIKSKMDIKYCNFIGSPMLLGFIKPAILLPHNNYPDEELLLILTHELIHFRRKDLWYKILILFANSIHWFNPIVYIMKDAISADCEISCDQEVLNTCDADSRKLYVRTIIKVIREYTKLQTAFSTQFFGGKKTMKNRIYSIMEITKKKKGILIPCAILAATLLSGTIFAYKTTNDNSSIRNDSSYAKEFSGDSYCDDGNVVYNNEGEMIVENITEEKEDKYEKTVEDYTIDELTSDVLSNNIEKVKKIISSNTVDLDSKDSEGIYPLEMVLVMDNCDMAKILLKAGANPYVITEDGISIYDRVMDKGSYYLKEIFREYE